MTAPPTPVPVLVTGVRRLLYVGLGLVFVGLAILGVILPVLPTTPFLLLASYFFVRSSPALHRRLQNSRLFGRLIRDWEKHRGVRPHVKVTALAMVPAVIFCSAYFGDLSLPLVLMLCGLGSIGMIVVIRLPVVRDAAPPQAAVPATCLEPSLLPRQVTVS